jgi:hypothetical protein
VDYFGYDLFPQCPEAARLDITHAHIPIDVDAIVMLGVTEYMSDLFELFQRLRTQCRFLIASHVVANRGVYSKEDLERLGWLSHKTEQEFDDILLTCGFQIVDRIVADEVTCLWFCRTLLSDGRPFRKGL